MNFDILEINDSFGFKEGFDKFTSMIFVLFGTGVRVVLGSWELIFEDTPFACGFWRDDFEVTTELSSLVDFIFDLELDLLIPDLTSSLFGLVAAVVGLFNFEGGGANDLAYK